MSHAIENVAFTNLDNHALLSTLAKKLSVDKNHYQYDIKNLSLTHCSLNEDECCSLSQILKCSEHLNYISLSENHIDVHHLIDILKSINPGCLSSFMLTDNWIGEDDADSIVAMIEKFNFLTSLNLELDGLGNPGIIRIANYLNHNKSITEINLSCNNFYLDGLVAITSMLKNNQTLTSIDLSCNLIDSKKTKYVADSLRDNFSLIKLDIRSNQIEDEGAVHLAKAIAHHSKLSLLNLSDNKISVKGLKTMMASALQSNLRRIDMSHNRISQSDLVKVRKEFDLTNQSLELVV